MGRMYIACSCSCASSLSAVAADGDGRAPGPGIRLTSNVNRARFPRLDACSINFAEFTIVVAWQPDRTSSTSLIASQAIQQKPCARASDHAGVQVDLFHACASRCRRGFPSIRFMPAHRVHGCAGVRIRRMRVKGCCQEHAPAVAGTPSNPMGCPCSVTCEMMGPPSQSSYSTAACASTGGCGWVYGIRPGCLPECHLDI